MTPHLPKAEVGIRELHDQLSRYVRHVREGGEVVVTVHGRPVARITPIDDGPDQLAALREQGLITEPTRQRRAPAPGERVRAAGSVSDFVADQRQ